MSCMDRPPKKTKQNKNGPCREVTVKEETPYTDWNQWGNTTENWRLLCLPRQICRFSKIAAQSQAISLHELCQQNFLFSVIFKRVRSRSHHQKKFAWLACLHRTPTSNTKWVIKKLCELVSGHKRLTKNSAGNKLLLGIKLELYDNLTKPLLVA